MTWAVRLLHPALGVVAVGAGMWALAIAGALASTPCKEERGDKDCPTVPLAGAVKAEILPSQVRPYRFSESHQLGADTDPNNAGSIICVCEICESKWRDRAFARAASDATKASPTISTTPCRPVPTIRGYLIGVLGGKEILTAEGADRRTALRWLDVDRMKVRKEQIAIRKDDFLGNAGDLVSAAGDSVVAGDRAIFTNAVGLLRSYPSRTELPNRTLKGIYLPEIGRGVLDTGTAKYAAENLADGVVYRRFVPVADQDLDSDPLKVGRIWGSERWILRSFSSYPAIWMVSRADGSEDRFLAYDALGACGQPLMGDYALNLQAGKGYSVMALSLLPDVPDYRVGGIPLDRLYCVAGDGGVIAVTGRYQKHPALAIYQDGAWQRVLLPDSPSVLEPVVMDGRILVSAPEEASTGKADGEPIPSAGAVYVLAKDASTWRIRQRIVPANPRRHGVFGYKLLAVGQRLFINYLDNYPKAKGMPREGFGYPSVCETTLP